MAGYYIPSIKGGGPIQSIKNLVDNLSDRIDFYIVANDRDLGDDKPFDNVEIDKWVHVGNSNVFYTDRTKLTWKKTKDIINSIDCSILYLNSFFDYKFSTVPIILRRLNKIQAKFVLAPRGQFSPGALGLKSGKKNLFICITKVLGLYNSITFHATAESEKRDIERIFGDELELIVANNLTANYEELTFDKELKKVEGELKIIFVSRVHPKKNLKKAIEFLKSIKGNVEFNIFGPIEDKVYWSECESTIHDFPLNIKVNYKGIIGHDEIINIFKRHHVFLFPTLGENFGHVISEALIGGCPVIISDQTPWRDLNQAGVGWDIELKDEKRFIKVIQHYIDMEQNEYNETSYKAFKYGLQRSNLKEDFARSYALFD